MPNSKREKKRGSKRSKGSHKKIPNKAKQAKLALGESVLPKTAKFPKKKSSKMRLPSHASSGQSITKLQLMAKSHGIPFGGLDKSQLIDKINQYIGK